MRRRIYLARHGDVSYFQPGQDLGHDDPPLNPTGIRQAEALGQLLQDAPIDAVACTDLLRTRQTAELAVAPRAIDIEVIEGLSEAKTGNFAEIDTPEQMEAIVVKAFEDADQPGARFLTGESYADLWARVDAAWQSLLARTDWKQMLVVAHGVVNRTILAQSLGAGTQIFRRLEQDAGCLNVLDVEGTGDDALVTCVRLVNFTPYNAVKTGMQQTTLEMLWQRFLDGD